MCWSWSSSWAMALSRAHTRKCPHATAPGVAVPASSPFHLGEKQAEFAGYVIQQGPKYAFALIITGVPRGRLLPASRPIVAVKLELWLVAQLSRSSASVKLPAEPFTPPFIRREQYRSISPTVSMGLLVPRMHGQYLATPRGRLSSYLDVSHWIPKLDRGISPQRTISSVPPAQESLLKISITSKFDHDASPLALSVTRLGRGTWRSTLNRPSSPSISPLASGFLQANQPLGGTNTKFLRRAPRIPGDREGTRPPNGKHTRNQFQNRAGPSFLLVSHF